MLASNPQPEGPGHCIYVPPHPSDRVVQLYPLVQVSFIRPQRLRAVVEVFQPTSPRSNLIISREKFWVPRVFGGHISKCFEYSTGCAKKMKSVSLFVTCFWGTDSGCITCVNWICTVLSSSIQRNIQWLRLDVSNGPNWVGVSHHMTWSRKRIHFPKR
jgi:hypothetical protein